MKLLHLFAPCALFTTALASCTPEQRIEKLEYIVDAFNEVDFEKSAELVANLPVAPQCEAYLFINGLPGVNAAFDSATVKDFSQVVRQAFVDVDPKYSAADNNTATLDAIVTLGVLHVVQAPVRTRIVVPAVFDEDTCLITELPTYITVPTDIAGNPIDPPIVPTILGLDRLPGFQPILETLIPVIGNLYNLTG